MGPKIIIIVTMLALSACTTASGSFCDLNQPTRLSAAEVDALSDRSVEQILAQNEKGRKLCGWRE